MTDFCSTRYDYHGPVLGSYSDCHPRYPPPPRPHLPHDRDVTDDRNDYRFEIVRRRSFKNWPVSFLDPERLAEAGFYYTNEGDKVICFECRIEICKWVEGDDPKFEHQRWSERCRFVRKIPCGNVPIGTDPANVPPPLPRTRDVCGPHGFEARPVSGQGCCSASPILQDLSTAQLGSLGIGLPKEPEHPQYASRDARLRTYKLWPKSMKQTKEELADAGFFYTGKGDQTLCYLCGGGLKDWEPTDNPWEQHALWFSKCYYLLTVKGQAFVDQVKGLTRQQPSAQETKNLNLPNFIQKVEQPAEAGPQEVACSSENEAGTSSIKGGGCGLEGRRKSLDSAYGSQEGGEEEKRVDDSTLCKICFTEELGVVFLPCGHMVACVKCAPSLTTCAVCRQPFTMTVRAFIS